MKLAINYSHPAAALVERGQIHIDRFKTPDWPDLVEEAARLAPVAVHFGLDAGPGELAAYDWDKVRRLREQTGTKYVNLHLAPYARFFPDVPLECSEGPDYLRVYERMLADVTLVAEMFGPENVIVENVPYRGASGRLLRPGADPQVIRNIAAETGCGLLLDISHARIAAGSLGINARAYMQSLPVERLRELHFTGLHEVGGLLQDHLPVLEADWPVLEWVLERIAAGDWAEPWMLAFEYGGVGGKLGENSDAMVIAEQTPRLYEMVG